MFDGVLADFGRAARNVCHRLFNGKPDPSLIQTGWGFDSLGITPEEQSQMYMYIDAVPNWWHNEIDPLPQTDLLPKLCEQHRVIFITNRKDGTGAPIEEQTASWLHWFYKLPFQTVLISDVKGPIVKALRLDAYIDDRPSNIQDALWHYPKCLTVINDTTYNREFDRAPRVANFNEFAKQFLEE